MCEIRISSTDFKGKNLFHVLLFRVDGAEVELHCLISASSSTTLPF